MDNSEIRNKIYRGGAPVGYLSELNQLEQNAILFLRYWSQSAKADHDLQSKFWADITYDLGITKTRQAIEAFDEIFTLCVKYSRRPIMKHDLECKCIGGDESYDCGDCDMLGVHFTYSPVVNGFIFQGTEEVFFVLYVLSKPRENYRRGSRGLRVCNF